jgi:hypothetical protein
MTSPCAHPGCRAVREAATKVAAASNGVRLPLDTGRDTPGEELWGALLLLRAALSEPVDPPAPPEPAPVDPPRGEEKAS